MPILGALFTAGLVNLIGVLYFFDPIRERDASSLVAPPMIGFSVFVVLSVLLFDWTSRQIGSAYKSAFVVGASQAILIIDMMLTGKRGMMTAGAGVVLVGATWIAVAFIYSSLEGRQRSDA